MQSSMFAPETDWTPPNSLPELSKYKEVAIDLETYDPLLMSHGPSWAFEGQGYVTGIAIATEDFAIYLPIQHVGGGNLDKGVVTNWLKQELAHPNDKVFHNSLYDLGWLRRMGVHVSGKIHDTMFAAPLVDENQFGYSLNKLGQRYVGEVKQENLLEEAAKSFGLNPKSEMYKLPAKYVGEYAEQDAALTLKLWKILKEGLKSENVEKIYELR